MIFQWKVDEKMAVGQLCNLRHMYFITTNVFGKKISLIKTRPLLPSSGDGRRGAGFIQTGKKSAANIQTRVFSPFPYCCSL